MDTERLEMSRSSTSCVVSMASISSEGSVESSLMEQEDIAVLTHDVRNFKEALGKLRRTLSPYRERQETLRVAAHERLGDVLRILRNVLEKYLALQSTELLVAAGTLIQNVKGFNYEDEEADPKGIFESIDQLALSFSSRVSEYLMGDLDTNVSLSSSVSSKTKSCENLVDDIILCEDKKEPSGARLLPMEQAVEFALARAKEWAKYAKDIMMYVEKRTQLEMEYMRRLNKLATSARSLISEENNIPFQSLYCTALDHDTESSNSSLVTCRLLLGNKFMEPLSARRVEHEKIRRQLKDLWFREVASMHNAVLHMRRARGVYVQRCREKDLRMPENDYHHKTVEAETSYNASVAEANESHERLSAINTHIVQQVRQLLTDSDGVMRTATTAYFQLQHSLSLPLPQKFQTLFETSQLHEPGLWFAEEVKHLPATTMTASQQPFAFEDFSEGARSALVQDRMTVESVEGVDLLFQGLAEPMASSDTDSVASTASSQDADSHRQPHEFITDLNAASDPGIQPLPGYMRLSHRHSMSKAAETHTFRKLKTPSRCRECDSYVYFQGADCSECGLACHRKCLETLAIQCGHKRLPRKMTTFGVDLKQHLEETNTLVPHIVCKCIAEIDARGRLIKGIYRVSGVKSKVEKLCQAFENGAELVDLTDTHPNVIANVLKLYLRQLPEPLLTFHLYADFVRIAKDCSSNCEEDVATNELKELVKKLPSHHFLTLSVLMMHLQRVSSDSHINNMPPGNLGIVFGPTLLRTAEGSASLSSLVDTVHQTRAIEIMISNSDEIFAGQNISRVIDHDLKAYREGSSVSSMEGGKKVRQSCRALEEADFLHNTGNISDDDLSYFLSTDGSSTTHMAETTTTKIFKGSLKDYQGLEGLSSSGKRSFEEDSNIHRTVNATVSNHTSNMEERSACTELSTKSFIFNKNMTAHKSISECENMKIMTSDDWRGARTYGLRVDSLAESDSSVESRASGSMESQSSKDLEEVNEVFLDTEGFVSQKSVSKEEIVMEQHKLESESSTSSSFCRTLGSYKGNDGLDVAITRTHIALSSNLDEGENTCIPLTVNRKHREETSEVSSCSTVENKHLFSIRRHVRDGKLCIEMQPEVSSSPHSFLEGSETGSSSTGKPGEERKSWTGSEAGSTNIVIGDTRPPEY